MSKLSKERIGEIAVLGNGIAYSTFPVITKLTLETLAPITALAWATLISVPFFVLLSFFRSSWANPLDRKILPSLMGTAIIVGVLLPSLVFWGLKHTSAGNAGILLTFEVLATFLFFNVWRREEITREHVLGAGLMFTSALLIFSPGFSAVRSGDFILLAAMSIPPLGNLLQKRVRQEISSEQILFFRAVIGIPALFLLAAAFGEPTQIPKGGKIWTLLFLNGTITFCFARILWIEAIHRIGVTRAISLSGISPALTLLVAFLVLGDVPTPVQLSTVVPAILGVILLTQPVKKRSAF